MSTVNSGNCSLNQQILDYVKLCCFCITDRPKCTVKKVLQPEPEWQGVNDVNKYIEKWALKLDDPISIDMFLRTRNGRQLIEKWTLSFSYHKSSARFDHLNQKFTTIVRSLCVFIRLLPDFQQFCHLDPAPDVEFNFYNSLASDSLTTCFVGDCKSFEFPDINTNDGNFMISCRYLDNSTMASIIREYISTFLSNAMDNSFGKSEAIPIPSSSFSKAIPIASSSGGREGRSSLSTSPHISSLPSAKSSVGVGSLLATRRMSGSSSAGYSFSSGVSVDLIGTLATASSPSPSVDSVLKANSSPPFMTLSSGLVTPTVVVSDSPSSNAIESSSMNQSQMSYFPDFNFSLGVNPFDTEIVNNEIHAEDVRLSEFRSSDENMFNLDISASSYSESDEDEGLFSSIDVENRPSLVSSSVHFDSCPDIEEFECLKIKPFSSVADFDSEIHDLKAFFYLGLTGSIRK